MELCLVVDHACNLRCGYCYTGKKFRRPMSDDTMRKAVRLALVRDPAWLSLSLFGGEPLLEPGILHRVETIVEEALAELEHRPQLRYIVDTNGTCWSDENLAWLEAHNHATAIVSLDGERAVHDRWRRDRHGEGTQERVVAGLSELRKRQIDFQLVAVVTPETAAELGTSLAYLLTLGSSRIALQPQLRANWTERSLTDLSLGLRAAAQTWADAFLQGTPPFVEPFHGKVWSHVTRHSPLPRRCQAGVQELTVAPSGRLYSCGEMVGEDNDDTLCLGSVDSGIDEARVHAFRGSAAAARDACGACPLRERCSQGCACKQRASSGAVGRISALLCAVEGMLIDHVDEQAQRLVDTACPSFLQTFYGTEGVPRMVTPDVAPADRADLPQGERAQRLHLPLLT